MSPNERPAVRVVLADDQELIRAGFRLILERAGVTVVAEAADGLDAIEATRRCHPDVVLMDIRMPRLDGLEATRRLLASPGPHAPRVLVLTTFDIDEYVYAALRCGASGFLLKDHPADQLGPAVRAIAAGDALLAPTVTRRLVEHFATSPDPTEDPPAGLAELTPREREVFVLIARGLTNRQISEHLVIGDATVKTHVARVFAKLGLHDRAQAVVLAYETGTIRPGGRVG